MTIRMPIRMALPGAATALALLIAFPARSQEGVSPDPTLEEKVRALEAQQKELARRLEELKDELERKKSAGVPTPAPTATPTPTPTPKPPGPVEATGLTPLSYPLLGSTGSVTSGTSFNPSIAVIPDFAYSRDDRRGDAATVLESADGFGSPHAAGAGPVEGALDEGFNFRETEISFKGSVDPYFDVMALFAASEEGLEAEEVYLQTRRLPLGLTLKAGKFFSGIGYLNSQHPHQWDFVDSALPNQLLLGGTLAEKGVQVTWLPKLPVYLQVGAEALQGESERVAGYAGDGVFSRKAGPRLFTGFVRIAPEIGFSDAVQVGLSYARSTRHQEARDEDGDGVADAAFEGTVDLLAAEAVFKHDAPHAYGRGDLTLQAEYFLRNKRLDLLGAPGRLSSRQDGAYLQAVYGVLPRLQVAARFDVAGLTNRVTEGGVTGSFGATRRVTAALTFNPTEFSRLRIQWDRADVKVAGASETVDRLLAMVQVSLGAHGAHRF